jgi:hypothetical protein
MIVTTDDLCLSHLHNFIWFDRVKSIKPDFRMIAFTIANYKNHELLLESLIFQDWFEKHKNWVEIGVHSYDHEYPPDGDRDNEKHWIEKARDGLKPFLPEKYGYRSPGWQTTNRTIPILKELGFTYIAYERQIRDIVNERITETQLINTHLYDEKELEKLFETLKGGG